MPSKLLIYTGIGSRQTPQGVQNTMTDIARKLSVYGYTLRSGGAEGADMAFEIGAHKKEIYLPWKNFNNNPSPHHEVSKKAKDLIKTVHPTPEKLTTMTRKLHGRNAYQILGENLTLPSRFVIFWAPEKNGIVQGETSTAVKLAKNNNIPTYNMYTDDGTKALQSRMVWCFIDYMMRFLKYVVLFYTDHIEEKDLLLADQLIDGREVTMDKAKNLQYLFSKYKKVSKEIEEGFTIHNF